MLARVDDDDRCRAARRGAGAVVRRDPHGEAGRRDDPLRGRAGQAVVPDVKRKLPGRGVWVTATRAAVAAAAGGVRPQLQARRPGSGRSCRSRPSVLLERVGARCARHRRQGGPGGARVRQGRGGTCRRPGRWPDPRSRCEPGRGAQARCRGAAPVRRGRRRRSSMCSRRRNWIWQWAGQMWYMQPCSPAPRRRGFLRAAEASRAFAAVKAAPRAPRCEAAKEVPTAGVTNPACGWQRNS